MVYMWKMICPNSPVADSLKRSLDDQSLLADRFTSKVGCCVPVDVVESLFGF